MLDTHDIWMLIEDDPSADSVSSIGEEQLAAGLRQFLSMCLQVRQQEIELDIAFDVMEVAMQEEECKNKHVSSQYSCTFLHAVLSCMQSLSEAVPVMHAVKY